MNILILHTQVPFVRGGAEVLVDGLRDALAKGGHAVDTVALPLSWNPPERLLTSALAWRLLDLSAFNARPVDLVICTKYPTWAVEHPNKALWLIHQHRQAYDLFGTPMSELGGDAESRRLRDRVIEIDRVGIGECGRRYAISRNVAGRLRRYCGIDAAPLYPPVPRSGLRAERYDPFILSVARLDASKRVDLAIRALSENGFNLRLVVAGDGPDLAMLRLLARRVGVADRVDFVGRVSDDRLRELYNSCRAVYYAPVDEDYGYTTVEALAAAKPVITTEDAGGVLEFVDDGDDGLVTCATPGAIGESIRRLEDENLARRLGGRGPERVEGLSWDAVVEALVG
ncbi:MAG TPA: glycosyltransferase family 4 protein [Thermomicrobiales bacterium]|nr:glycosyltransferase family 4 protein [Thermomicrobiales bacterium]